MRDKTEDFIEEAEKFNEEAAEELERAEKEKNAILFRDACEKGWNAIIQATNALFLKKNLPLAKSHWERRKRLEERESVDPGIENLGLADRFILPCRATIFFRRYCEIEKNIYIS